MEEPTIQKPLHTRAVIAASCVNYAGACFLAILWQVDLFYYLPVAFFISCVMGLLIADVEKSIVYTFVCVGLGYSLAAAILLSPYVVFAESAGRVNIAGTVILSSIAKLFLVSVFASFLGGVAGGFGGERALRRTQSLKD